MKYFYYYLILVQSRNLNIGGTVECDEMISSREYLNFVISTIAKDHNLIPSEIVMLNISLLNPPTA